MPKSKKSKTARPNETDEYRAASIFWVPKEARWSHLKASAPQAIIGRLGATLESWSRCVPDSALSISRPAN